MAMPTCPKFSFGSGAGAVANVRTTVGRSNSILSSPHHSGRPRRRHRLSERSEVIATRRTHLRVRRDWQRHGRPWRGACIANVHAVAGEGEGARMAADPHSGVRSPSEADDGARSVGTRMQARLSTSWVALDDEGASPKEIADLAPRVFYGLSTLVTARPFERPAGGSPLCGVTFGDDRIRPSTLDVAVPGFERNFSPAAGSNQGTFMMGSPKTMKSRAL